MEVVPVHNQLWSLPVWEVYGKPPCEFVVHGELHCLWNYKIIHCFRVCTSVFC